MVDFSILKHTISVFRTWVSARWLFLGAFVLFLVVANFQWIKTRRLVTDYSLIIILSILGGVASFPWIIRSGLLNLTIIGAIFCGLLALFGKFIGKKTGSEKTLTVIFGVIGIVIVFLFSFYISLLPV